MPPFIMHQGQVPLPLPEVQCVNQVGGAAAVDEDRDEDDEKGRGQNDPPGTSWGEGQHGC